MPRSPQSGPSRAVRVRPMHEIDPGRVRQIARLARLSLSDDEILLFSGQLSHVLAYVEQLSEVNVVGVEPMAHPLSLTDVLREDDPTPSLEPETALLNAPQRHANFFKVPAVLDPAQGA